MLRSGAAGSQGNGVFIVIRNRLPVFWRGGPVDGPTVGKGDGILAAARLLQNLTSLYDNHHSGGCDVTVHWVREVLINHVC